MTTSFTGFNYNIFFPAATGYLYTDQLQYLSSRTGQVVKSCCNGFGDCDGENCCSCGNYQSQCKNTEIQSKLSWNGDCQLTDKVCYYNNGNQYGYISVENGNETCTVYEVTCTFKIGQLAGVCPSDIRGKGWNVSETSNTSKGWSICDYTYDFTNYNTVSSSINGPIYLQKWVRAIMNGTSPAAPSGIDKIQIKKRIRDSNFIYACLLDFYNQLYSTGYYASNKVVTPFSTLNFIAQGFVNFISILIQNNIDQSVYDDGGKKLSDALQTLIATPSPAVSGTNYFLNLPVSYTQYETFLQSSNQEELFNQYTSVFFRDTQGSMQYNGDNSYPCGNPQFTNISIQSLTIVSLDDYSIKQVNPSDFTSTKYPNYMFAFATIQGQVSTWSPMLAIYFQVTNPTIGFDSNTCQEIASQAGFNTNKPFTLPTSCFTQKCNLTGGPISTECMGYVQNYCGASYNPPSYTTRGDVDSYILCETDNTICGCYNSLLNPTVKPGDNSAMCFSKSCNTNQRSYFGLTDSVCSGYCQDIIDLINQGTTDQTRIDQTRVNQLCGTNFQPYTPKSYNQSVLICGIILSLLTSIAVYLFTSKKLKPSTSGLFTFLSLIVIGSITAFFSRDLAGVGSCASVGANAKFVCRSRITGLEIPEQFCDYKEFCECAFDKDCPSGCKCQGPNLCLPESGQRKFKTVSTSSVSIPGIVTTVIGVILVVIAIKQTPISPYFSILPIVVGIGLIAFLATRKKSETVPDGTCCPNSCEGKECGTDACGNNCGTCSNNQTCNSEGQCICPDSCGDKVCGQDSCGNSCGTCPSGQVCNKDQSACVDASCAEVNCSEGQICIDGKCLDKTNIDLCNLYTDKSKKNVISSWLGPLCSGCGNYPGCSGSCTVDNPTFGQSSIPTSGTMRCFNCKSDPNCSGPSFLTPDLNITPGLIQLGSGSTQLNIGLPVGKSLNCNNDSDCQQMGSISKCNLTNNLCE